MKKRWLVIGLIIVLLVLGSIFLFSSSEKREVNLYELDVPDSISDYELAAFKKIGRDCLPDEEGNRICSTPIRAEYYDDSNIEVNGNDGVYVVAYIIQKSKNDFIEKYHEINNRGKISSGIYISPGRTPNKLYWFTNEYDIITVEQYVWRNDTLTDASLNNPVIKYYLEKYPPK